MGTPSERLAATVVARLVTEGLLTDEDARTIQPRLAEGTLRPEDWRLPIEVAGEKGNEQWVPANSGR